VKAEYIGMDSVAARALSEIPQRHGSGVSSSTLATLLTRRVAELRLRFLRLRFLPPVEPLSALRAHATILGFVTCCLQALRSVVRRLVLTTSVIDFTVCLGQKDSGDLMCILMDAVT